MPACPNCQSVRFELIYQSVAVTSVTFEPAQPWPHYGQAMALADGQGWIVQLTCHDCGFQAPLPLDRVDGSTRVGLLPLFPDPNQLFHGSIYAADLQQLARYLAQVLKLQLFQPSHCLLCDQPRAAESPYFCLEHHQRWRDSGLSADRYSEGRTANWSPIHWDRPLPVGQQVLARINWERLPGLIYAWLEDWFKQDTCWARCLQKKQQAI